jgi:hypothetical protein
MDVEEAVILCVPNMVQDFLHISTVALREVDACFFFFLGGGGGVERVHVLG